MNCLYLIPARGGSKGIPNKNIKILGEQPLIFYSIKFAQLFTDNKNICVSTDSNKIKSISEKTGIKVPFIRPEVLATDTATSEDVIKHAIEYYRAQNIFYDTVILLQPTSPFRKKSDLEDAISIYKKNSPDMVCSYHESDANPYYNMFEEDKNGNMQLCKKGNFTRRQDCPKVYEQNGSIYIISVEALFTKGMSNFTKIKKCIIDKLYSQDIDSPDDWDYCEYIIEKEKVIL